MERGGGGRKEIMHLTNNAHLTNRPVCLQPAVCGCDYIPFHQTEGYGRIGS